MDFNYLLGYFLAIVVGIILGVLGSGGSILSVPVLVYIMKIEPVLATTYSLFTVGATALIGGIQKAKQNLVDFKKVFLFGIPALAMVFITRKYLLPLIPETINIFGETSFSKSMLIMVVFSIVLIYASYRMIKPFNPNDTIETTKINYSYIVIKSLFIGLIAGVVGAGGGFLFIPALIVLAKTPVKVAMGTSLFIVALQCLLGFFGGINNQVIDWSLLSIFVLCSIIGVFIGGFIAKRISSEHLKKGFGYFVLTMGLVILFKEFFSK
jgi:uncharacterized membrane protein YfcA